MRDQPGRCCQDRLQVRGARASANADVGAGADVGVCDAGPSRSPHRSSACGRRARSLVVRDRASLDDGYVATDASETMGGHPGVHDHECGRLAHAVAANGSVLGLDFEAVLGAVPGSADHRCAAGRGRAETVGAVRDGCRRAGSPGRECTLATL